MSIVNNTQEYNQLNPKCGRFYRTNERKKRRGIKRDLRDLSIKCRVGTVLDLNLNKPTVKTNEMTGKI